MREARRMTLVSWSPLKTEDSWSTTLGIMGPELNRAMTRRSGVPMPLDVPARLLLPLDAPEMERPNRVGARSSKPNQSPAFTERPRTILERIPERFLERPRTILEPPFPIQKRVNLQQQQLKTCQVARAIKPNPRLLLFRLRRFLKKLAVPRI